MNVTATCTGLVSLKIHAAQYSWDNRIFGPFFAVNQFPNLEILDLKLRISDIPLEAEIIENALKPLSAITNLSLLDAALRAEHFRLIKRFSNLKQFKLEKKNLVVGGALHLRS